MRTVKNSQPILAGAVAGIVGFSSSFTIVLAGLKAVGATDRQASSGLLALCVVMGAIGVVASLRTKMPIVIAWSTPGAALMVTAGAMHGGFPAALGACVVAGVLTVIAGVWRPLARGIAAIPPALASALLAGVLLPVCLAPAHSMVQEPWLTTPVVLVWIGFMRFARRWAVPASVVAAVVAVVIKRPSSGGGFHPSLPHLAFVLPKFDIHTIVSFGIPLFIVTMACQNIAGMAVLGSFGYSPPMRPLMVATGVASAATAPFGAHAINMAALTAALVAGPDADPEPERRWIAGATSGFLYILLGPLAAVAAALVVAAPAILVEAVAGLALLGALTGALAAAVHDHETRDAAVITLVVSVSGITAFGISAPFWGLIAGLAFYGTRSIGFRRLPATETASS